MQKGCSTPKNCVLLLFAASCKASDWQVTQGLVVSRWTMLRGTLRCVNARSSRWPEDLAYPRETLLAHASAKTLEKTPAGGRRTPTKRENEKSLRGSHLSAASAARPCATAAGPWLVPTRVSCTFSWQQSAEQPPARRTPHAWRYLVPQLAMLCAPRRRAARRSLAATGASPSCDRNAHRHRRTAPSPH